MSESRGRKSIFITGAASGIGAEAARYFAKRGWFVGLYDLDEQGLAEVADVIGGGNSHMAVLDVRDRAQWAAAVNGFGEATHGQMNVLFNNAGVGRHGWFEDIPPEDCDWIVDVNVKGVVNGVYAALPLLRETHGARIINTASTAGMVGSPRLAVYSATKFAVRGLTEALDVEFSGLGIRVTSLMPWFVDTPILDIGASEGANVKMADEIRAIGQPVYSVGDAAAKVWEAAHGDEIHYMVGKEAERARFAQRFMPGRLKKQILKGLPERE
ncbi:MAG: SDR family oxidoreductase [Alphaproteobacteria bacterium]|jgi:NAD(P)-dependent dehydrogenase (short-subunit alcohol dehydrogenase family)|nr:SDR family oxidoreductase [Alphaproteobacteria bacterium]